MTEVKLTKNELRDQQVKLNQLNRYLPTLQLKKAMLQSEVSEAKAQIIALKKHCDDQKKQTDPFAPLLTQKTQVCMEKLASIEQLYVRTDNIAGVEIPVFERADFTPLKYQLFSTQVWVDAAVEILRALAICQIKVNLAEKKREALEKELREVSIRVNLFEKVLIPRAKTNIKKIKVFLGDQQLAAVSQAKVAKKKIEKNKKQSFSKKALLTDEGQK